MVEKNDIQLSFEMLKVQLKEWKSLQQQHEIVKNYLEKTTECFLLSLVKVFPLFFPSLFHNFVDYWNMKTMRRNLFYDFYETHNNDQDFPSCSAAAFFLVSNDNRQ